MMKKEDKYSDLVINYNEWGSSAKYIYTYDKEKIIPKHPDSESNLKYEGYSYNAIKIYLHINFEDVVTNKSVSLLDKDNFNEWLSSKTLLEFKNNTIDNKVIFSPWLIEFPYASQEKIESLVKSLEDDIEVYNISYGSIILPEYDTEENRIKMIRSKINFN